MYLALASDTDNIDLEEPLSFALNVPHITTFSDTHITGTGNNCIHQYTEELATQ